MTNPRTTDEKTTDTESCNPTAVDVSDRTDDRAANNAEEGEIVAQTVAKPRLAVTIGQAIGTIFIGMIRLYQKFSRTMPSVCRFHPTCSEYAAQAIAKHGPLKGCWLGVCRICRCHPFSSGGYDPVP
jgi:hypothetical protein